MNCTKCKTRLKIRQVYLALNNKTQRAVCPACSSVFTVYSTIVYEDPGKGEGAEALANAIEGGEKTVRVEVRKQSTF